MHTVQKGLRGVGEFSPDVRVKGFEVKSEKESSHVVRSLGEALELGYGVTDWLSFARLAIVL